jgi:hypothetical protein
MVPNLIVPGIFLSLYSCLKFIELCSGHVGKKLDTTIKICKLPCDLPDNWASLVNTPLPKNKTKKYNTPSVVDAPWVNKNG